MKKKIALVLVKISIAAVTVTLLLILFLNVSTIWATEKIKRGESITSGYFNAIISSGSMEPVISVNDLLIIKGASSYQYEDVITYVSPRGSLVTHRVIAISDKGYVAQGDANNIPDEDISNQRVLGKVVSVIPGVGGIVKGVLSPIGIVLLVCILLLVWLIQKIRRSQDEAVHDKAKKAFSDIDEASES